MAQLIKYLLLSFLILGFETYVSAEGMSSKEFLDFCFNYYRNPQPDRWLAAFDYYWETGIQSDVKGDTHFETQISPALFWGLIAKEKPIIPQHAQALFLKSNWEQKKALLQIFKYLNDPQIKANLQTWAQSETADDRRLFIQKSLLTYEDPLTILKNPIQDEQTLVQNWTFFFVAGNTRVASASIELLANTSNSYSGWITPLKWRKLRQQVLMRINQRCYQHQSLLDPLLEKIKVIPPEEGKQFITTLMEQALDLGEPLLAKKILPWVDYFLPHTPQNKYYHEAVAVLENQSYEGVKWQEPLEVQAGIWAERLRGYACYFQRRRQTLLWQETKIPGGNKDFLTLCLQTLAQRQAFRSYETWNLSSSLQTEENSNVYYNQFWIARSQLNRCFCLQIKPEMHEGWFLKGKTTFRWIDKTGQWIEIQNALSRERIELLTSTAGMQNLLETHLPIGIYQINNPEGEKYVKILYENLCTGEIVSSLKLFFQDQEMKIILPAVIFYAEKETGKIIQLELRVSIQADNQETITGMIKRYFYDDNDVKLNWADALGQK